MVGVVALPLSMALAIASGVPPQHGLYTAIVAGAVIALLGGSRVQVSGPTAAFVVILAPIAAQFGVGGLLLATLMAGVHPARHGRGAPGAAHRVRALPGDHRLHRRHRRGDRHAADQGPARPDRAPSCPTTTWSACRCLVRALPTLRWSDALIAAFTLGHPAPLAAPEPARARAAGRAHRGLAAGACSLTRLCPASPSPPSAVPSRDPAGSRRRPALPWHLPGPRAGRSLSLAMVRELIPPPSPSPCWAPSSRCSRRWSPTV